MYNEVQEDVTQEVISKIDKLYKNKLKFISNPKYSFKNLFKYVSHDTVLYLLPCGYGRFLIKFQH